MPKTLHRDISTGDVLHLWRFNEYISHDRNFLWYIIFSFLGIGLVVYAIWTDNYLFAFIIVLVGIILFIQSKQSSPEVQCAITEGGVILGDKFYGYGEFEEFFIVHQPPDISVLFIETKDVYRPNISIPLVENDPMDIRSSLREFLPENLEKDEEPLSELVTRLWRIQ
jgi:hypothetical protein